MNVSPKVAPPLPSLDRAPPLLHCPASFSAYYTCLKKEQDSPRGRVRWYAIRRHAAISPHKLSLQASTSVAVKESFLAAKQIRISNSLVVCQSHTDYSAGVTFIYIRLVFHRSLAVDNIQERGRGRERERERKRGRESLECMRACV